MVLKAESVSTRGRRLPLTVVRPSEPEGVVPQNTLDWVVSLDFPFPSETRLNIQAFQSITSINDPDVIPKKRESGYSVLLNGKLTPNLEAEFLWVASHCSDWMLRPKLNWNFEKNWRLVFGVTPFAVRPPDFSVATTPRTGCIQSSGVRSDRTTGKPAACSSISNT